MRGDLRSDSYVLPASCSACVYECVNRSGVFTVGVNEQMRPEDSIGHQNFAAAVKKKCRTNWQNISSLCARTRLRLEMEHISFQGKRQQYSGDERFALGRNVRLHYTTVSFFEYLVIFDFFCTMVKEK